jgi:sigma-E factor negative regulatory protein RseB
MLKFRMHSLSKAVGAVVCMLCLPVLALETPVSVGEILARLESAERETSFKGQFTHEHGGTIDTFEILRLVVDGIEYEKTSRLSGPPLEQVKIGRDTRCLTKSNHLLRGSHLNLKLGGAVSLEQSYVFYLLGEDRIAGRDTLVVRVEPRDAFRYGYWLSVDKQSGLVMRSIITAGKKKALERIQYVSVSELDVGDNLQAFLSEAHMREIQARIAQREKGQFAAGCDLNVKETAPWRPGWVPPGFLLTSYSYTGGEGHMETYSDGLSVFSVFVNNQPHTDAANVMAHRGATVAVMSELNLGRQLLSVAVVGEIPLIAAQKISASIATSQPSEP